jgi:dipeptidase
MDFEEGVLRPIYWDTEDYPRFVGKNRGSDYYPKPGQNLSEPIGYIPQVRHTFAYYDATYGVMNEHQVAIGESTCSGVFGALAKGHGGQALMSVDELSKIAMERTTSAKEAVLLMGDLAFKHGFYGAGQFEGGAESLLVGDPGDAWIFHILPDPTGTSAIWVAQHVPEDHAAAVDNMFVIRAVDLDDKENFLGSPNLHSVAQAKGWWKPGEVFDFTKIYSDGEYVSKYYSGRRQWRSLSMMAPSLHLNATYGSLRFDAPYPATVKPDKKIAVQDIFHYHRDYYDGTPYDTHKGLAAGAFGNPDRYAVTSDTGVKGAWERTIALYRTGHSYVSQLRSDLPADVGGVSWFGAGSARYTVYLPLPSGMLASPTVCATGGFSGSFEPGTHFWAVKKVANVARLHFSKMIGDIDKQQKELEDAGVDLLKSFIQKREQGFEATGATHLTEVFTEFATKSVKQWETLSDFLIWKYADGYSNDPVLASPLSYPADWLKAVGYPQGPPPVPSSEQGEVQRVEEGTLVV